MQKINMLEENYDLDIAIIGMSCRFPGAKNVTEFWGNLLKGIESIKRLTDREILDSGVDPSYLNNPSYVKASPVLDQPGMFDASFFGFTSNEALTMDPQQRILLTCAYEALENAGHDPDKFQGRIGVYTGSAMNTYLLNTHLNEKFINEYIPTLIGNDKDFLSTKISYKLNLKGPSLNVQTACSTSLVAVHLACQSLLTEECDMAITGAISVKVPHDAGYIYDGGGIVSPEGHVRSFDSKANGTVFGSGAGIIVLRRLNDAIKDRDNILAVIKGSAINNDGGEKAGYTAPGIKSQADVVIEAISNAGINPERISYIETHGSGTPVGDPIEISALTKAFRKFTNKTNFCALGSVKTNIGHLDAAAGIAGIIKTVLALNNRMIPASLNYKEPNPEIDFLNSPFYVNSHLSEWKSNERRIAGVMSTGMGGTNAHIIIQEAPVSSERAQPYSPALILLSAKDELALEAKTRQLLDYLLENDNVKIKDTAYTLQAGRKEFDYRKFFVAGDKNRAIEILKQKDSKKIFFGKIRRSSKRPIIFLFPGVGDQYVGMGYNLYQEVKVFRDEVDKCAEILKSCLGCNIKDILYPDDYEIGTPSESSSIDLKKMLKGYGAGNDDYKRKKLNQTLYAQPILFTIEYALAKLWMHLGIVPDAIAGHSMGEYVAACLSGVLSLEDALKIISERAKLVKELPMGGMLAVTLPEKELLPLLDEKLSISLMNSPDLCVIAGSEESVNEFEKVLESRDIIYRRVQNSHAFHSKMMNPIFNELAEEFKKIRLHPPQIPYLSNVTGDWITKEEAVNPYYWAKHTTSTSRFSEALDKVWQIEDCIMLEAGPGNTLSVLAMQNPGRLRNQNPVSISSLRPGYDNQSDLSFLLTNIGKLWLNGESIKWENLYEEASLPKRIPLPTYPFQEKNYWLKAKSSSVCDTGEKTDVGSNNRDINKWFYIPGWKRTGFTLNFEKSISVNKKKLWLIFLDENGLGLQLKECLEKSKQDVIAVKFTNYFSKENASYFLIDAHEPEHYYRLLEELKANSEILNIIHLGCYSEQNITLPSSTDASLRFKEFYSLIFIIKALARLNYLRTVNIEAVSNNIHQVTGNETLHPLKALILGPCGVIPKEFSNIMCFNVDLAIEETGSPANEETLENLISEFDEANSEKVIAYRGKFRWVKRYDKIRLTNDNDIPSPSAGRIKKNGVYLITGGTGGIGLTLARYLAKEYNAKLVLTQRSEIPDKSQWTEILDGSSGDSSMSQKLRKFRELEDLGSELMVIKAGVTDRQSMREVISKTENSFGRIDGVIHCAGIVRAGIIRAKEITDVESVLAPKVNGTLILYDLIKDMSPDFFILCSSITAITSPFAEIDYSAANSFLDVFSHYANSINDFPTLSINWPGWKETGQLANLETKKGTESWKAEALQKAIFPREGLEAFKLAINSGQSQIIVSPEPLDIPQSYPEYPNEVSNKIHTNNDEITTDINGEFSNRTGEDLSIIWTDILGVKEVKKEDNFFELGGHSLLAIQLISAIRKTIKVELNLEDILNAMTFSKLEKKINDLLLIGNTKKN